MLGWTVLNQLKQDPRTRHIPVQILTLDEDRQPRLARGAFSFVTKPTTTEGLEAALTRIKELRAAAPQAAADGRRQSRRTARASRELLGHDDIDIDVGRHRGGGARGARGIQLRLRRARPAPARHVAASKCSSRCATTTRCSDLPVVVFTGRELQPEEDARLHMLARSVVVKGRRIAGAAARRDGALPASRGRRPAAGKAAHARPAAPVRRSSRRPQGAHRRRRRPQYLRALAACWNAAA